MLELSESLGLLRPLVHLARKLVFERNKTVDGVRIALAVLVREAVGLCAVLDEAQQIVEIGHQAVDADRAMLPALGRVMRWKRAKRWFSCTAVSLRSESTSAIQNCSGDMLRF